MITSVRIDAIMPRGALAREPSRDINWSTVHVRRLLAEPLRRARASLDRHTDSVVAAYLAVAAR